MLQEGRIPEGVLAGITEQVLAGLSYLHRHKHTVSASIPSHMCLQMASARCMLHTA